MYQATTNSIRVRVEPQFLDEESDPDEGHYFWSYTVEITNLSETTVQLESRYWKIVDSHGRTQEVRGLGVVGEQPVIDAGESYSYTSGVPLSTPSGFMSGAYAMRNDDDETFNVDIPAFSLDCPDALQSVN